MQRAGIFANDFEYEGRNVVVIRSAHFKHEETKPRVYCAPSISYKPLTEGQNEDYRPLEANVNILRYFLRNIFRKTDFREGQLPILTRALENKSVIGLLPTGGGKSLTYQLAAMMQPGITLVVGPLRSLMIDQHRGLVKVGMTKTMFINSTLSPEEKRYNQIDMTLGASQIIFISPERLVLQEFRDELQLTLTNGFRFAYCVLDEVHCVSEWGHDFRTPYLFLGKNAQEFGRRNNDPPIPFFGLTATASFDVLADIERELLIPEDDGQAIVRYENTVRNEIVYSIVDSPVVLKPANLYDTQTLRGNIATNKRAQLRDYLENKDTILRPYSETAYLQNMLATAYQEYIPENMRQAEKAASAGTVSPNFPTLESYQQHFLPKLQLAEEELTIGNFIDGKFQYGMIIFAPHRSGLYGIRTKDGPAGLFDDLLADPVGKDKPGFFVGAGDDSPKEWAEDSIEHMTKFVAGESSIMVATKAFGMGIDKPDIRLTFHLNIPSSIESFVQEAGRAARDGKLALATIYYNRQAFQQQGNTSNYAWQDPAPNPPNYRREDCHYPDKHLLDFFHRLTFQGILKERVMLDELLTNITYKCLSGLEILEKAMSERFGMLLQLKLHKSRGNGPTVYVKCNEEDLGYYIFQDKRCWGQDNTTEFRLAFENEMFAWVGINNIVSWDAFEAACKRIDPFIAQEDGLETLIDGPASPVLVSFANGFNSYKNDFGIKIIHPDHLAELQNCKIAKAIIAKNGLPDEAVFTAAFFKSKAEAAISSSKSSSEFIESLLPVNAADYKLLQEDEELQNSYCKPRNGADTAKAIYRLSTLDIIDTYTISYNAEYYSVTFSRKPVGYYLQRLEELFARYTSKGMAAEMIVEIKKKNTGKNKPSEMRLCLSELTNFVYHRIEEKRKTGYDCHAADVRRINRKNISR